jgi:membrane-associated phospholipid phosphatase
MDIGQQLLMKLSGLVRHYTFIDYATQTYIAAVGLLVLVFHGTRVAHWPLLVLIHAVGLGLVHLLIRTRADTQRGAWLEFLRWFYPVILYTGFYRETGDLNRMFISDYLDPTFIRIEGWVFGFQPSLEFMERLPYLGLSEVLYASYFSYYLMIGGIGVTLFFRRRDQLFHYISIVSFVFYNCYSIYIFLPVIGPRTFFREIANYRLPDEVQQLGIGYTFPAHLETGPFCRIMKVIYFYFEAPGAAFPSSHVAVALCTLYFSFRYLPKIRWPHGILVLLLCLSTVYCRYHYAVDVVAGILAVAILVPAGNWLFFKYGTKPPFAPPGQQPQV